MSKDRIFPNDSGGCMFHDDKELYEFSDFRLDISERLLLRKGKRVPLSEKAFEMLCVLIRQSGHLVSKDELLTKVWADTIVEENNLDKNISLLRRVLGGRKDKEKFIETVRGRGYRFVAEVRRVEPENAVKDENRVTNYEPEKGARQTVNRQTAIRNPQSKNVVALADWRHAPEEAEKSPEEILPAAQITEIPKAKHKNYMQIGAVISGLLILALGFFALTRFYLETPAKDAPIESIAVLPFENASGDENLDYLSDGLSESVIDRLSQLPQLKVIARNSSFKYRGANIDVQDAATKLGVQAIVTGRITQRGENLLIRVEMIDTRENRQLWSEQFNRKSADALAAAEEIARTALEKLRPKLSGAEAQKLAKNYTENAEAYQLYLRGHFLQYKITPQDLYKSIEFYQQAVALDPNFALAYVGLAESTGELGSFRNILKQNYMQKAREYALKAVSLDNRLPEAHATLGSILLINDYDFASAEREFNRALELNPNYAEAYLWRGQLFISLGRHEEALAEIQRGIELDPMSPEANSAYGEALFFARRYDESIAHLKKILNLDANYFPAHRYLAFNYEMKGDYAARIAEAVKLSEIIGAQWRGEAMKKSFDEGGWQGFLRDATADNSPLDLHGYLVATFCAELGDKDKAFAILEKLYEEHDSELVFIKVDPRLDKLRDDPRFQDLLRRVGLPQ